MKTYLPVILILSFFILFLSCSNKPKRSRKPFSTIRVEPKKNSYVESDSLVIAVTTKVKDGELETVKLYLENELLFESNKTEFLYTLKKISSVGQLNIKAVAKKTDGLENTRLSKILVLSEKTPSVKKYRLIKEYPHSVVFFTQGLEFHDGYIYEGTGENGSSGLYKVNLVTGKPVKSFKLNDKYFGEGITILNEKIYQLTYRTKVGFVYRLSDFALIDSFKYSSPEGWGLTNDGTYLIMSNGTNRLTWLDSETYQVVKSLQVADNKGLVQNLNELEYYKGNLLANIWTTEMIAEIDPETGKILSYIDLKGILSVMYKQRAERIDVMNGIAWNRNNDNLFVTGKLWPKLYEIEITGSE